MGCHPKISAKSFPEQDPRLGKRAVVLFHYEPAHEFPAKIIRLDAEDPWRMIFQLDDGRVVLDSECQYIMGPEST